MARIGIRSQFVRQWRDGRRGGFAGALAPVPDPVDEQGEKHAQGWQQADVERAIAAAEQAGLNAYRIEIHPDGTISIVVGNPADSAADPGNYPGTSLG